MIQRAKYMIDALGLQLLKDNESELHLMQRIKKGSLRPLLGRDPGLKPIKGPP